MTVQPSDTQFFHFIALIRDANVRDDHYLRASQKIVDAGESVRSLLSDLLLDAEKLVQDRAAELLSRLDLAKSAGNCGRPMPID